MSDVIKNCVSLISEIGKVRLDDLYDLYLERFGKKIINEHTRSALIDLIKSAFDTLVIVHDKNGPLVKVVGEDEDEEGAYMVGFDTILIDEVNSYENKFTVVNIEDSLPDYTDRTIINKKQLSDVENHNSVRNIHDFLIKNKPCDAVGIRVNKHSGCVQVDFPSLEKAMHAVNMLNSGLMHKRATIASNLWDYSHTGEEGSDDEECGFDVSIDETKASRYFVLRHARLCRVDSKTEKKQGLLRILGVFIDQSRVDEMDARCRRSQFPSMTSSRYHGFGESYPFSNTRHMRQGWSFFDDHQGGKMDYRSRRELPTYKQSYGRDRSKGRCVLKMNKCIAVVGFRPDTTKEDIRNALASYSIEDVIMNRGKLFTHTALLLVNDEDVEKLPREIVIRERKVELVRIDDLRVSDKYKDTYHDCERYDRYDAAFLRQNMPVLMGMSVKIISKYAKNREALSGTFSCRIVHRGNNNFCWILIADSLDFNNLDKRVVRERSKKCVISGGDKCERVLIIEESSDSNGSYLSVCYADSGCCGRIMKSSELYKLPSKFGFSRIPPQCYPCYCITSVPRCDVSPKFTATVACCREISSMNVYILSNIVPG